MSNRRLGFYFISLIAISHAFGKINITNENDFNNLYNISAVISTNIAMTTSRTIDESVTLEFVDQGKFTVSTGTTITINGTVLAPLLNIFNGNGNIQFTSISRTEKVFPQWWGAIAGTDIPYTINDSSFNNAFNSMAPGMQMFIPQGTYLISHLECKTPGISITGGGTLKEVANGVALSLLASGIHVNGLAFDGTAATIGDGHNNIINIQANPADTTSNGKRCIIENITITGSRSNGIDIQASPSNIIKNNKIYNVNDNGIVIHEVGADSNIIEGNIVSGTAVQNCIFITTTTTDTPPTDSVVGNIISNNIVTKCGDSPIESGRHAFGTRITGNYVEVNKAAGILIRDGKNVVVNANVVKLLNGALNDGIAVVQHSEAYNWKCKSIISNNIISGDIPRAGIYIGQHDFLIANNYIEGSSRNNSYGIEAGISGTQICNNRISKFTTGIDFSQFGGASFIDTNIDVSGNYIDSVYYGINLWNSHFNSSRFVNNYIIRAQVGFYLENSYGNLNSDIAGNQIHSTTTPYLYSNVWNLNQYRFSGVDNSGNWKINLTPLDLAGNKIMNVQKPTSDMDAATKKYVDSTILSSADEWQLKQDTSIHSTVKISKSAAGSVGPVLRLENPANQANDKARVEFSDNGGLRSYIEWNVVSGGYPSFNLVDAMHSNASRLFVDQNGLVGIGATTPGAKLEVSGGDIKVSSNGNGIILKSQNGTTKTLYLKDDGTIGLR